MPPSTTTLTPGSCCWGEWELRQSVRWDVWIISLYPTMVEKKKNGMLYAIPSKMF